MAGETRLRFVAVGQDESWREIKAPIYRALEAHGLPRARAQRGRLGATTGKMLERAGLVRQFWRRPGVAYVITVAWGSSAAFYPHAYCHEVIPYGWDYWASNHHRWVATLGALRVRVAFLTSRQAVQRLGRDCPDVKLFWLPEAVDMNLSLPGPDLAQRRIDVLELGRRWDSYHDAIAPVLARAGRSHLFEPTPGAIVFPTFQGLQEGMAQAKVTICFPRSMTHPALAGDVETVTRRYFECFASRSLVVGHAPAELIDFFGYNPVIETSPGGDAASQIMDVVDHIDRYQDLVERNRARTAEVATWDKRIEEMLMTLRGLGYEPG